MQIQSQSGAETCTAEAFLQNAIPLPGVPGHEEVVSRYVAGCFEPYCEDVHVDAFYNVIAREGQMGPVIMLSAHMDEIGLMVLKINEDGSLRVTRNGGVDPRILPGLTVTVHAQTGPLFGVVGAKAPHLLTEEERGKAVKLENLYVDIGMPAGDVHSLVRVGDPITMHGEPLALAGSRMAAKTMDDRACVAVMLECAKWLKGMKHRAQVTYVASTQEEVGFYGAQVAGYSVAPDMAIALDVTHGEGPGTGKFEAYSLDKVVATVGPNIHPMLHKKLEETAKRHRVELEKSVCGGVTGTDASVLQISRAGVPTILIEVPLRYMHTTVETLSLDTLKEAGRLLAHYIADISVEWEGLSWT